jgi:hypothetical protein
VGRVAGGSSKRHRGRGRRRRGDIGNCEEVHLPRGESEQCFFRY